MRFNDFNIVALIQNTGCRIKQLENEIHPDRHIGCKNHRNVLGRSSNCRLAFSLKARCTNNNTHTRLTTLLKVIQRSFRAGKVDQTVDLPQA